MCSMGGEGMAKRSVGRLMRKKLSDITNSQPQSKIPVHDEVPLENFLAEKDCIERLLQEKMTLVQLLAERNKIIELSGAELQRLRSLIQKLQQQNWNLAQSNSQILVELNLGRERMKALQHDIICKAALLKGKYLGVEGKVDMDYENNGSAGRPSINASNSNDEKPCNWNMRSQSLASSLASTKDASKDKVENKRQCLGRLSANARSRRHEHEHETLLNLFEIEDAKYPVIQSAPKLLKTGENSTLRNEAPVKYSFGRPMRKTADKVQSYSHKGFFL